MSLLESHLEQISLSSVAIAELPFVPPKIFTNALLHSHDITALIRDTEAHERALFTSGTLGQQKNVSRRSTANNLALKNTGLTREPGHGIAVTRILGPEVDKQTKKDKLNGGKDSGEIDVNVLLNGAEKLCAVYPMPGVREKIGSLRMRYEKLSSSIANYESRVSQQTIKLARMNRSKDDAYNEEDFTEADVPIAHMASQESRVTTADLEKEVQEIRELEKKKRALEDRIRGIERDLGT